MGTERMWVGFSACLGFLGVALGAFGAHGLRAAFETHPERLSWWHTAAQYHLWHALAVGLVAFRVARSGSLLAGAAGWCFSFGILFFSGSLYGLGVGGPRILGMITPVGGLLLLGGWALLGLSLWR